MLDVLSIVAAVALIAIAAYIFWSNARRRRRVRTRYEGNALSRELRHQLDAERASD